MGFRIEFRIAVRVHGSGFGVWGLGLTPKSRLGITVQGLGFRVDTHIAIRVQGPEFRVQGSEFRVQGPGFRA